MYKIKGISEGTISNSGIAVIGIITILLFTYFANAQVKSTPPNIIFIICDQMRADAIGVTGNRNAITPNLDKLANSGIICRNNLTNNSVCLPSRISMFSGKYPSQTSIKWWANYGNI